MIPEIHDKFNCLSDPPVAFWCDWCGEEIFVDYYFYEAGDARICSGCFDEVKNSRRVANSERPE